MAVGSIHNAMSRNTIEAPFGYIIIGLSILAILIGLILARYYEGLPSVPYGAALGLAAFVAIGGIGNILSTEELDSLLFHEYLLPIAGTIQVAKLAAEKFMVPSPGTEPSSNMA